MGAELCQHCQETQQFNHQNIQNQLQKPQILYIKTQQNGPEQNQPEFIINIPSKQPNLTNKASSSNRISVQSAYPFSQMFGVLKEESIKKKGANGMQQVNTVGQNIPYIDGTFQFKYNQYDSINIQKHTKGLKSQSEKVSRQRQQNKMLTFKKIDHLNSAPGKIQLIKIEQSIDSEQGQNHISHIQSSKNNSLDNQILENKKSGFVKIIKRPGKIQKQFTHKHLHTDSQKDQKDQHLDSSISTPSLLEQVQKTFRAQNQFMDQMVAVKKQKIKLNKDIYIGQLNNRSKPQGFGRLYKNNKQFYIGYFRQGKAQGKGLFVYIDGSYYKGSFQNDLPESQKAQFKSENIIYQGGFHKGQCHGHGKQTGKVHKFQGTYAKGLKQKGKFTWIESQKKYCYQGSFNNQGKFDGQGILQQPYGHYKGTFKNGSKHGDGQYTFKDGRKYLGSYVNGQKEGKGIIYLKDNSPAYVGQMKAGIPHGKGWIFRNGEKILVDSKKQNIFFQRIFEN